MTRGRKKVNPPPYLDKGDDVEIVPDYTDLTDDLRTDQNLDSIKDLPDQNQDTSEGLGAGQSVSDEPIPPVVVQEDAPSFNDDKGLHKLTDPELEYLYACLNHVRSTGRLSLPTSSLPVVYSICDKLNVPRPSGCCGTLYPTFKRIAQVLGI